MKSFKWKKFLNALVLLLLLLVLPIQKMGVPPFNNSMLYTVMTQRRNTRTETGKHLDIYSD